MAELNRELLAACLREVRLPEGGTAADRIDGLQVRGGLVQLSLRADRAEAAAMEAVRREAQAVLARQPGVMNASVVLTAHRPAQAPAQDAPAGPGPETAASGPAAQHGPHAARARTRLLAEVPHVVAVASGKGGVGKSTVAVNLAAALAATGLRVGMLDADVYGPSLPTMLGMGGRPELEGQRLRPARAWGMEAMSMGLLVDPDRAMVWRGPMVMSALEQMMDQVAWGPLDLMVVDMPPGTGDAQLTMAQRVSLSGAVVVSTPQDVALIDARRAVRMFEKVMVPVLGLVENMSIFCCPRCGERTALFGHGGARREAETLGVPFLGEIPLLLDIRTSADAGAPIVAAQPESEAGRAFTALARAVLAGLGAPAAGPRIVSD